MDVRPKKIDGASVLKAGGNFSKFLEIWSFPHLFRMGKLSSELTFENFYRCRIQRERKRQREREKRER